ncbi:MAG: hypothetical protein ACR2G0_06610 [Chthoniobacterales bacterium]
MKTSLSSHKPLKLTPSRWGAYVIAGAASALAGSNVAEGSIHYSGVVNSKFTEDDVSRKFPLSGGASLSFSRYQSSSGFFQDLGFNVVNAAVSASFRGRPGKITGFPYVGRLDLGEAASSGKFLPAGQFPALLVYGYLSGGQWTKRGGGYVGFVFNNGAGRQYGWARVRSTGLKIFTDDVYFIVRDYAWGDPGDSIVAGQTTDARPEEVPAKGSLGLLAVGAAALVAWRRARDKGGPSAAR